jgi:hypothetical protein
VSVEHTAGASVGRKGDRFTHRLGVSPQREERLRCSQRSTRQSGLRSEWQASPGNQAAVGATPLMGWGARTSMSRQT